MGYLKGKSALMIFDKHANLKYKFEIDIFGQRILCSTVGLNEATIKKYIQEQERKDIALDKLSVKNMKIPLGIVANNYVYLFERSVRRVKCNKA